MDFRSVVTRQPGHTHTQTPLLALNFKGNLGDPITTKFVTSIIVQKIPEPSSAALELQNTAHRLSVFCMQTLQCSEVELQSV